MGKKPLSSRGRVVTGDVFDSREFVDGGATCGSALAIAFTANRLGGSNTGARVAGEGPGELRLHSRLPSVGPRDPKRPYGFRGTTRKFLSLDGSATGSHCDRRYSSAR